jgi:hypothetical protein
MQNARGKQETHKIFSSLKIIKMKGLEWATIIRKDMVILKLMTPCARLKEFITFLK